VLATAVIVFAYGRAASMDMLLATCVTLSIGFFALRVFGIAGRLAVPAACVFLGLGTLAKGPLGLLLPALVILSFSAVSRDLRPVRLALHPAGFVLLLAVAAPWYAAVYADQGRHFVDVFLLNHNVARFTSTVHNHPGPVVYYLPVFLLGLFPWSGLTLPAVFGARPRLDRVDLFLMCWLLVPLAFFSLAGSKLPGYVLPCLPPLALLMGRAALRLAEQPEDLPRGTGPSAVGLVGLCVAAVVAAGPFLLARRGEPSWSTLLPACLWAVLVAFALRRRLGPDPAGAFRLWRTGAAGFLLLLTLAAPPILARHESGRGLFLPANGREVLAFGAWRTAWMAGYFYNDGRVREVASLAEVRGATASAESPVLVLCGPGERRQLEGLPELETLVLAEGPRQNALLRVSKR
jgi:4-amino-4-deoxy-L-arabinose transferase-like glycosyltransferase